MLTACDSMEPQSGLMRAPAHRGVEKRLTQFRPPFEEGGEVLLIDVSGSTQDLDSDKAAFLICVNEEIAVTQLHGVVRNEAPRFVGPDVRGVNFACVLDHHAERRYRIPIAGM